MDAKIYTCFISSPSDTVNERKICDKVFNEINGNIGKSHKFRIESLKWENDVHPGVDVDRVRFDSSYHFFIAYLHGAGTPDILDSRVKI